MTRLLLLVVALAAMASGFLDATASQDFVPAPNVIPVAMDDSRVAVVPNSPVAVNTLPAEAAPPRVTATPYDVLQPVVKDAFAMPPFVLQDHMPAVPAVKPLLNELPAEKELCNAFETPQEKVDVGCTWRQHEEHALPQCVSSHTPTSLMGQLKACDPVLYRNMQFRVKETLQGTANDCTWIVVNSESFARLFCDAKARDVLVQPRRDRAVDPEACAKLQTLAPGGVIDVGCEWLDHEMAPVCASRLTPKGAMHWLKMCDRDAFENVSALGVQHIRGNRTECKWSMTPSKAVLVTSAQVLLCPFVTETRAAPSKAVRPEACAKLQEALPDGQIPVGCLWDRADPLSVPRCRSVRATPTYEVRLFRECDALAFDNLVLRVRNTLLGEETDCKWRNVGSRQESLFCSVVPVPVIDRVRVTPTPSGDACALLDAQRKIRVGCTLEPAEPNKKPVVQCLSTQTEDHDMSALRRCDVKTWRLVQQLVARVVEEIDPTPCEWSDADASGVRDLVCPLH